MSSFFDTSKILVPDIALEITKETILPLEAEVTESPRDAPKGK